MTQGKVALFIFIDAMGWELIERFPRLLGNTVPERKRLKTIFGYSSACDPSIISGMLPSQHSLWSSFYYSPQTSPFGRFRWLGMLPKLITDNHRVRGRISRYVASCLGYTGYVQLYNVPFDYLSYFDYAEKKRIYEPGGLPKGKSIFDILVEKGIPYHMCGAGQSDVAKCEVLKQELQQGKIELAYVTLGQLDALMHKLGTKDSKVEELLLWYEKQITEIVAAARKSYEDVSVYVFADHGMHDVVSSYDLQKEIDHLGLQYGIDYVAMYDSTMARFWFLNGEAKDLIEQRLEEIPVGRMLEDAELKQFGVYFADRRYGETIYLMNPSMLIAPSFMGQKQIPGMHGYHPDDPCSFAALLSNREIPEDVRSIHHIFKLMVNEISAEAEKQRVEETVSTVRNYEIVEKDSLPK